MNILFVNLEDNFGSSQYMLLKEMSLLKARGHKPYLYCLNESYLHVSSIGLAEEHLLIPMARDLGYFRSKAKGDIKRLISEKKIDMVLLYGEIKAQTINWIMQGFNEIPYVLFLFESFNGIKRKQSLGRVDEFFTRSEYVSRELQSRYSVSGLKIKKISSFPSDIYIPQSIRPKGSKQLTSEVFQFGDTKGVMVAASIVNDDINRVSQLEDLFFALKSDNIRPNVRFIMFSSKKWTHRNIHSELRRTLKDYGLEDTVLLKDLPANFNFESLSSKIKFWFSFNQLEAFNADYVFSLLNKIPTIFPRRSGNLEIHDDFELSGVSYRPNDSGDIRRAFQLMLSDQERFRKSLSASGKKISEIFQPDQHGELLESYLHSVFVRRRRLLKLSNREKGQENKQEAGK
jgi:hypothetical protein